MERVNQAAVDLSAVRPQFHGPAVALHRLDDPPVRPQCVAEVLVRLGVIGPELQGPFVSGDRFRHPS
jgi:hypothetical protein